MMLHRKKSRDLLVLSLHGDTPQWYCQHADGRVTQGHDAAGMPAVETVRTLLLFPGEHLLLATVSAGSQQSQQWQLEPLLSEEAEHLHIVDLLPTLNGRLMAAVAEDALHAQLDKAAALGYSPQQVLPDVLTVPTGEAWQIDTRWLIHPATGERIVLSDTAWQSVQPYHPTLSALTQRTVTFAEIAQCALSSNVSLLPPAAPNLRQPLLALSAALCLLLSSLLAEPVWQGWQAQRALTALQQNTLARYQQWFPNEQPDYPRRAFARKLAESDTQPPSSALLPLLTHSAALLATQKENPVQTLNWDAQHALLRLTFSQPLPASLGTQAPAGLTVTVKDNQMTVRSQ